MKVEFIKFILTIYNHVAKREFLRTWIKKLTKQQKIKIKYDNAFFYVGTNSAIEQNLLFDTYNEKTVLEVIKKCVLLNYHFIDIGANIGIHSLIAAKTNATIEIYSFEPEPDNFSNFINHISINEVKNIRPFKMGLGNVVSNLQLNINEDWNKGKHSLKVKFDNSQKKINIPINVLDNFSENVKQDSLLIKIDVEGFEKEVIEGAITIFENTPNIVLLIELVEEINGQSICNEIISMLQKLHFDKVYKIKNYTEFEKVSSYQGSADYVLIKGRNIEL